MIEFLRSDAFRPKVTSSINKYLSLSKNQSLTAGFYRGGKLYVISNEPKPLDCFYDIGSISKTTTAHLILSLVGQGKLELDKSVSEYLDLPLGNYPTLYELLTHTAGYGHLTPAEITVPSLLAHGYARRNIYERCTKETVLKCLGRRGRRRKKAYGYSYSDFPFAILAVVAEAVTGKSFSDLIEDFVQNELGMKNTVISLPEQSRNPRSAYGSRTLKFWRWNRNNPYIAGGGLVSNVEDMLAYIAVQIKSSKPYIIQAHRICERSLAENRNLAACIGWHTYKKSNQLWHVGGVGTFRSSVVLNKKRKIGVIVLGNSKGVASANVHYLAKMLYSEMKIGKIDFEKVRSDFEPTGDFLGSTDDDKR